MFQLTRCFTYDDLSIWVNSLTRRLILNRFKLVIYTNTGQSKRGIEIEAVKDQETFRKDDISIKRRVLRNDSQTPFWTQLHSNECHHLTH